MILIEFTPTGRDMIRCALDDYALNNQWFSYLQSIDTIKYQLTKKHGGLAAPEVAQINFFPELFASIGEYPATANMRIIYTETDEDGGQIIHDGAAFLDTMDRSIVTYDISRPAVDAKIPASTTYNDTLVNVVTTLCGPTLLNLTVDSSRARATSPAVLYTTPSSEMNADDLLADMCAWFCHVAKRVDGVLYLIDMFDTSVQYEITEFDTQPCEYRKEMPYSLFQCGDRTLAGSNPAGEVFDVGTAYHNNNANIDAALADIKTIVEMDIATIMSHMDQVTAGIADRISYLDESMRVATLTSGIITSIIYSPDDNRVEAEVIGSINT